MEVRALVSDGAKCTPVDSQTRHAPAAGWLWIDIRISGDDGDALAATLDSLLLDPMALRDAAEDDDLPKVDHFDSHLLLVLHGLSDEHIATHEVDCFLTDRRQMVTVRSEGCRSIDVLWRQLQESETLAAGGVDELAARLADLLTRRLLAVLDAFDGRIEELIAAALEADGRVVADITAVRSDLSVLRRAVHPQREALDIMRASESPIVSDAGRRRFSDVFDVATRAAHAIDAARTALAETLEAYRGAEARQATDVTKVLTIYAAVMFPLSLIAGFFGMNFPDMPGADNRYGWAMVLVAMVGVTVLSLAFFVALGWIRRPSARAAGSLLGRGLIEAARTPVQVAGAVYVRSTSPLRSVVGRRRSDG